MRDYGRVAPTFWTRGSGKRLRGNPHAQLVALYLFTCPGSTMVGIYHLAIPTMAHEVGITVGDAERALAAVCDIGIARYDLDAELVYLPGGARYQIGERLKTTDLRVRSIKAALVQLNGHPFALDFARRYGAEFCLSADDATPPGFNSPPLEGGSKGDFERPVSPFEARSGKDQYRQEKERDVGFEAALPAGAGPSCDSMDGPEPLADDLAPATSSGDLAPVALAAEAPVPGPAMPLESPDPAEDAPAPTPDPETVALPPCDPASTPADEPTSAPDPAPASAGPASAPLVPSDPAPPPPSQPSGSPTKRFDPVESIFAEYIAGWKRVVRGRRHPKLDDKRRRLTIARLRDFCEDDLKAAARGVFASEWHVENKQTDYSLVMRDSAHVERFMACDEATQTAVPGPKIPEWLSDAARPSARVREVLRAKKSDDVPSTAIDFDAMLDGMNSVEDVV